MSNNYNFDFFINNIRAINCDASFKKRQICIVPKNNKNFRIEYILSLTVGAYIFNINVNCDNDDNNTDEIIKLSYNNKEYSIHNGINSFDIYNVEFIKQNKLIFFFNHNIEYNIIDCNISENINNNMFIYDTESLYNTIETYRKKIKPEVNKITNIIYPSSILNQQHDQMQSYNNVSQLNYQNIQPNMQNNIHNNIQTNVPFNKQINTSKITYKKRNNIRIKQPIKNQENQSDEQVQEIHQENKDQDDIQEQPKVKIINTYDRIKQPTVTKNNRNIKIKSLVMKSPVSRHSQLGKISKADININIDCVYITSFNQNNSQSLFNYYTNRNMNCEIVNKTCNIKTNDKNNADRIFKYLHILSDAKNNKYNYIMIVDDSYIPINNLFINNSLIDNLRSLNDVFIFAEGDEQTLYNCIIKSTVYEMISKVLSDYSINFDILIKPLLNQMRKSYIPNYFISRTSRNKGITYIYYIPTQYTINKIKESLSSLNEQTDSKFILKIYKPPSLNTSDIYDIFDNKCLVEIYNNRISLDAYAIIQKYINTINTYHIGILPCDYKFEPNMTSRILNLLKEEKYYFINCGFTIDNTIINGILYNKETFTSKDFIKLPILNIDIFNIIKYTDEFNFYLDIFINNNIQKSFIFDSLMTELIEDELNIIENIETNPDPVSDKIKNKKQSNNYINDNELLYQSIQESNTMDIDTNENIYEEDDTETNNDENINYNNSQCQNLRSYNNNIVNIKNNINEQKQYNKPQDIKQINNENKQNQKIQINKNKVSSKIHKIQIDKIDYDEIINKHIDLSKDTIICYYSDNFEKNKRLYNICLNFLKFYNIIILSNTTVFKINNNFIYITYNQYSSQNNYLRVNKLYALFNNYNIYNIVQREQFDDVIFDIVEINNKNQLLDCINISSFITYSSILFVDYIKNILNSANFNNISQKQILHIPNCYNVEIYDDIMPKEFQNINKRIVSYIGTINHDINFNIIKYIADNVNSLDISLNIINTDIYSNNNLYFPNKNINWISFDDEDNLNNNINKYIKYSDIIIFPFNNDDNNKTKNLSEFYLALYYKKPIITTYNYSVLEQYDTEDETLIYTADTEINWIEILQTVIQELKCNIIYNHRNYNDKPWAFYSSKLYDLIQTNENLFLNSISDKIIKTCAFITKIFDNNNKQLFGFKQYVTFNILDILKENGIKPVIYQFNKYYQGVKTVIFNNYTYTVNIIQKDDLYTLNSYDYTIYDSEAYNFINTINPNSIYLNYGMKKNYQTTVNNFVESTILTMTTNSIFSDIYNYTSTNSHTYKINYISGFYANNQHNEQQDSMYIKINNITEHDISTKLFNITIPLYKIKAAHLKYIKEIIVQNKNENIRFNLILTNMPNKELLINLDNLKLYDNRFDYIFTSSFDDLINCFTNSTITLILNQKETTYLEYLNSILNDSIVITTYNNGINGIIINNFNGIIVPSENTYDINKSIQYIIQNYNDININKDYIINNYSYDKWKYTIEQLFTNIGWVYKTLNNNVENSIKELTYDDINVNFTKYWKNYTHTLNLQSDYTPIEVENAVKKHFEVNKNCIIPVTTYDKRIMILLEDNQYSDISYVTRILCQYTNSDVFVFSDKNIKYTDYIYNNINVIQLTTKLKNYDIVIYYKLSQNILEILKNTNIISIQYIQDISNIHNEYISYEFPTKIITHSPFISNFLCYKFNIIPIIISLPVNNLIEYPLQTKYKPIISCFTELKENDGIEIFIKVLRRYKLEYYELENNYDIKIYYYNYNSDYLQELKSKVELFELYIEFVEIQKNIDYYIYNSDLIVMPILYNNIPITLLKALYYNKNVIISSQFSTREFNTIAQLNKYNHLITLCRQNDVVNLKNCFVNWIKNRNNNALISSNTVSNSISNTISNSENDMSNNKQEYIKKYYSSILFINKLVENLIKI